MYIRVCVYVCVQLTFLPCDSDSAYEPAESVRTHKCHTPSPIPSLLVLDVCACEYVRVCEYVCVSMYECECVRGVERMRGENRLREREEEREREEKERERERERTRERERESSLR